MSKKIITFSIIISILFSSCVSKHLWSKTQYNETIKSFLISEDGKKLVVIGQKHHYIFNINNTLKEILLSNKKHKFEAIFSIFEMDGQYNIKGGYYLKYEVDRYFSNEEKIQYEHDIKWLSKHGFQEHKKVILPDKIVYTYHAPLFGKRYIASEIKLPKIKFNKPYTIIIEKSEEYKYSQETRETLSPVAMVADGIIVIGAIALVVVIIAKGGGGNFGNINTNIDSTNYYYKDRNEKDEDNKKKDK